DDAHGSTGTRGILSRANAEVATYAYGRHHIGKHHEVTHGNDRKCIFGQDRHAVFCSAWLVAGGYGGIGGGGLFRRFGIHGFPSGWHVRGSGQLAHTKSQAAVSQYRLLYLELAGRQFDAPLKAAIGNFHTPYAHARRSGHGPLSHDGQECSVDNDLYSVGSHSRQSDEHHNVRLCFKDIGGWLPGGPAVTRLTESEKLAVQTVGLFQHIDSLGPHG